MPTSRGFNRCVKCANRHWYNILCSWVNLMNLLVTWDIWPSTISIWYSSQKWIIISSSKQSLIYFIHNLLLVQSFSFRKIQASFSILLGYQSFFHILHFKITNISNWWRVVLIASIKVAHSWFPAWFINVCFWYFENIILELPAIPIIYPLSSILFVSLSSIPCLALIDQYKSNHYRIESWYWDKNLSWSRIRLYLDCYKGWQ